ncbi:universal stress protein [Maribacter sp. 2210JD10-5]|uniref:universal stress protein n=1 Tax=Maribacter sp. 2210JD10-5 TaxID=3386272 RepID=UPI0039BCFB84
MLKILVPTDFSENAYNALRYAIYLFEKEECTFYIINAFQTGASNLESKRNKVRETRLFKITRAASEKGLAEVLTALRKENDNPKHIFKTISVADSLLNAIGKSVLDYNIYYIFMGTQGASGLKSVFMGSNTVRVIRKIDFCPIVAVPADYNINVPNEILFATGFEHVYDKYELHPMLVLSKLWDSKILVLHLLDTDNQKNPKETAKKVIAKRLRQVPFEIMEIEKRDKVSKEIERIIVQNENIGMVAIIDYWHSFIEKLTHEPVVKNMAFKTKVPLLVMHLPE